MQTDEQRLVFGGNRANDHVFAVFHRPGSDVLRGVGTNRGAGQLIALDIWAVDNDSGVEGKQSLGRSEERIDVDLLDPWLLGDQVAEANQQFLECGDVDGFASANALQSFE